MDALQICIITGIVIAFGLLSGRLATSPITMPMVFVTAGIITEWLGVVDAALEFTTVALLAEIALALVLFSDAARIDTTALRRELGLPVRLLGVGLPLSIAVGTGLVLVLLPSLDLWEAALVAAVLAPTDAALGLAVVEERTVPQRIRQALNVESGLNDGIALPAVFLFAALAAGEEAAPGFWARFAARQIGLGLVIGAVVGVLGAWALDESTRRNWIEGINAQLTTLALAAAALAGATAAEGNGFIAAFVAGLVFGARSDRSSSSIEYTEDTSRLFSALTFFVFGNVIVPSTASGLTVTMAVGVVALLTIGRVVPVAIATSTARPRLPTLFFVGWFGPRGIASIVFVLIVIEDGVADVSSDLVTIVTWTVLASIFLHGITAVPGARAYGRWFDSVVATNADMVESGSTTEHRLRYAEATPSGDTDG